MIRNQIKVPKSLDLLSLDKLYGDLHRKLERKIITDLMIPYELTKNYLGISANLIQFTATWLRSSFSGKLIIDIETPNQKLIDGILKNEFLLPLIGLVWNNNGVYDKEGTNLRKYLGKPLNEVFLKMSKVESLKGDKLLLTNLDHLPNNLGILPCFENDGEFINNETELAESLEDVLLQNVLRNYKETHLVYQNIKRSFSKVVFELMKNTFEWAKADENDTPLDPNTRGVIIKFNKRLRSKLLEDYKSNQGVLKYFENNRLKENDKGELYFLEISVFDSGVGFVSKYKSTKDNTKNLSDIDIIRKCLIKHNTSSIGINKGDKGKGLDRILRNLNGKGWIRIKTGNKCIYRNLISEPYIAISPEEIERMQLFDWTKNSDNAFSNYEPACGSVITIIYPLSINN
jgi:hypothetical protein